MRFLILAALLVSSLVHAEDLEGMRARFGDRPEAELRQLQVDMDNWSEKHAVESVQREIRHRQAVEALRLEIRKAIAEGMFTVLP